MDNSFKEDDDFMEENSENSELAKDYGSMEYWEHRYQERKGERYDWL